MKITLKFSFLIILLFSANSFGQQIDTAPRGCVTEEGKQLNFLVGKWKVKSKTRVAGGGGEWEEIIGSSEINFVFDQCLLTEHLSIKREGRPLGVFALYSYNNNSNMYQWTFAHSEHGMLSLYEGPLNKDKFTFRYSIDIRGRKRLFKRELSRLSKGFKMVASRSNDDGKIWRVDSYLTYYR